MNASDTALPTENFMEYVQLTMIDGGLGGWQFKTRNSMSMAGQGAGLYKKGEG